MGERYILREEGVRERYILREEGMGRGIYREKRRVRKNERKMEGGR